MPAMLWIPLLWIWLAAGEAMNAAVRLRVAAEPISRRAFLAALIAK